MEFNNESTSSSYGGNFSNTASVKDVLEILAVNEKSTALGWGASPLNAFHDPELWEAQEQVKHELEGRTLSVPNELTAIPEDIQEYVNSSFVPRFTNRLMANYDNFRQRLVTNYDDFSEEDQDYLADLEERALRGKASPAELIYFRQITGIASIELGCLTHPYGNSIELLNDMRMSVSEASKMLNGELLDSPQVLAVKQPDNVYMKDREPFVKDSILMTRKQDLAVLPDGSIVRERSSFVLRIDEASDFDQKRAQNMRKIPLFNNPDWNKHLMIAGDLENTVPPYLEDNDFKVAIPLSTTIYAFNKDTKEDVKARDQLVKEQLKVERKERHEKNLAQRALGVLPVIPEMDFSRYLSIPYWVRKL
jgi:hypothetical protein